MRLLQIGYSRRMTVARWLMALALCGCATASAPGTPSQATGTTAANAKSGPRNGALQLVNDADVVQHQPTTDAVVLQRIDETVAEIPPNNHAARVVFGDVTYPRSQEELTGMGGFALLLVTAVTQDGSELPVDRVEVQIADKVQRLNLLSSRRRTLEGQRAGVLGAFRLDAVYLLPTFVTRYPATVTAYLGGGRYPLEILRFPAAADAMPPGLNFDVNPSQPNLDAIRRLLDEELPVVGSSGLEGH